MSKVSDMRIVGFGAAPKKRTPPGTLYPREWSHGFGSGPYPGPNGLVVCTQLDHSEYRESTNHWNALEWTGEKKACAKCGRPTYSEWFKAINWESRDTEYWREIFRTAEDAERGLDGGLPFIYLWESKGFRGQRLIQGDEDWDPNASPNVREFFRPKSVLKLLEQRYRFSWRNQQGRPERMTLVQHIRRRRYEERRPVGKENRYPGFDGLLRMELDDLAEGKDYVDNRRFAAVKSRADMRRYRKQRDSGCCGSIDKEVSIMGRKFMIGCNFGH